MNLLLPKLLTIQTFQSNALQDVLQTLYNLSQSTNVKGILCKKALLGNLISQLVSCDQDEIILSNLRVILNCSTIALGKIYLRVFQAVDSLICFLDSKDLNILLVTIQVISNILCSYKARSLYYQQLSSCLIPLLSHSDSQIQLNASNAIFNLAFDHAAHLSKAVRPLLSQLTSNHQKVIQNSLRALLNFCSGFSSFLFIKICKI